MATTNVYYSYRSTCGTVCLSVTKFDGDRKTAVAALRKMFQNSTTPIVRIFPPHADKQAVRDTLSKTERTLSEINADRHPGLHWNMRMIAEALREDLSK